MLFSKSRTNGQTGTFQLDDGRACRIRYIVGLWGWQDEEKWPQVHESLVDAMIRLEKALRPHLKNL